MKKQDEKRAVACFYCINIHFINIALESSCLNWQCYVALIQSDGSIPRDFFLAHVELHASSHMAD